MKFRKGFTLAEVLITLTIIGIIAALTLPVLMANIQKASYEKQTLKFYSILHDAVAVYRVDGESDYIDMSDFDVNRYFDVLKKCDKDCCYDTLYYNVSSQKDSGKVVFKGSDVFDAEKANVYMLKDNMVFTILPDGTFNLDVNGPKGPNVPGYDFWQFKVYDDGSIDDIGLTPSVKAQLSKDELDELVKQNLEDCKKATLEKVSGCFGHFVRNNFRIDY